MAYLVFVAMTTSDVDGLGVAFGFKPESNARDFS
jgi:hypothetical protein